MRSLARARFRQEAFETARGRNLVPPAVERRGLRQRKCAMGSLISPMWCFALTCREVVSLIGGGLVFLIDVWKRSLTLLLPRVSLISRSISVAAAQSFVSRHVESENVVAIHLGWYVCHRPLERFL